MSVVLSGASRRLVAISAALASGALLSGCVGMAPTYGTGKAADQQLLEDVSGMFSLKSKRGPAIDYKPRPELVKPAAHEALPAPQDNVVTASAGAWPESPEQRRARIRAEATDGRDDPNFQPEVALAQETRRTVRATRGDDVDINGNSISPQAQRAEFNRRLAVQSQGSPTSRRFLSEPPLTYRAPAETAAVGDVGEDEWKKDRRRKAGHTKKGGGWWPF